MGQKVSELRKMTVGEVRREYAEATAEHPFMIRRGDEWGFASAEFVQPGDFLIDEHLNEEEVESVARINAPTRTVAIHIPGTNTFLRRGDKRSCRSDTASRFAYTPHPVGSPDDAMPSATHIQEPLKALNAICPYYTMFPLDFQLRVLHGRARKGDWGR